MTRGKEYLEGLLMDRFQQLLDGFPKGKLSKSESPDFILQLTVKKSIGIEFTTLLNDKSKKSNRLDTHSFSGKEIPSLVRKELDRAINRKELKLKNYQKKRTNEIWLVIAAPSILAEVSINIHNHIGRWEFRSGFNRIYFMVGDKTLYRLV
jgi:hypothetical protein